jgi:hypothetical protein
VFGRTIKWLENDAERVDFHIGPNDYGRHGNTTLEKAGKLMVSIGKLPR